MDAYRKLLGIVYDGAELASPEDVAEALEVKVATAKKYLTDLIRTGLIIDGDQYYEAGHPNRTLSGKERVVYDAIDRRGGHVHARGNQSAVGVLAEDLDVTTTHIKTICTLLELRGMVRLEYKHSRFVSHVKIVGPSPAIQTTGQVLHMGTANGAYNDDDEYSEEAEESVDSYDPSKRMSYVEVFEYLSGMRDENVRLRRTLERIDKALRDLD